MPTARKAAQHTVHEVFILPAPIFCRAQNGFVHGGGIRHTVKIHHLVHGDTQDVEHRAVQLLLRFCEELANIKIERQTLFQNAIENGGGQRRVARRKLRRANGFIDDDVRVALVFRHLGKRRKRRFSGRSRHITEPSPLLLSRDRADNRCRAYACRFLAEFQ